MKVKMIGDVHAKIHDYLKIVKRSEYPTIQVGDFGVGFFDPAIMSELQEHGVHRFIRGNHDNPSACKEIDFWIPDGLVENETMFIGGAWSIDHAFRIEDLNWWKDEECSYDELIRMLDVYKMVKPRVMVTHDCPNDFSKRFIVEKGLAMGNMILPTRTGQALQAMWEIHQPDLWVFGHWHTDLDVISNGTRFICLDELSTIDVDFETFDVKWNER